MLAGRHDTLERFGAVGPVHIVFTESISPFESAINALADAQNLNHESLIEAKILLNSVAEQMATDSRDFVVDRLQGMVSQSIKEGLSVKDFKARVADFVASSGIDEARPWLVENLYRTEVGIGYGAGERAAYFDPDITDTIWGFRYVATHDERTRPDHAVLDGVELPKEDPFWSTHWPGSWDYQCRCTHEVLLVDDAHRIMRPPETITLDGGEVRTLSSGIEIDIDEIAKVLIADSTVGSKTIIEKIEQASGQRLTAEAIAVSGRDIQDGVVEEAAAFVRKLNSAERETVRDYTDYNKKYFAAINQKLRDNEDLTRDQARLVSHLDRALLKGNKISGKLYRILGFDDREKFEIFKNSHHVNAKIVYNAYVSTAKTPGVFKVGGKWKVNMTILGKNGVDISGVSIHPEQQEVLFKRYSQFVVLEAKLISETELFLTLIEVDYGSK